MQELRLPANLDRWEFLPSSTGALDVFLKQSRQPDAPVGQEFLQTMLNSLGRTVKTPVLDNEAVTVATTRSVTIADQETTSALYTITFSTYDIRFTMHPMVNAVNEISYERDFQTKMLKNIVQLLKDMDTAAETALDGQKTQVMNTVLDYAKVSNILEVPLANKEDIWGDIDIIMGGNDMPGPVYDIVLNREAESIMKRMKEFDQFNSQFKTLGFLGKDFHMTNRLANAAGHKATGYIINSGALSFGTRLEPDAIAGTSLGTSHEWDVVNLPILNIPVASYTYESAADVSALGAHATHLKRTGKQHFAFSFDCAYIVPYISAIATIPSPILKFAIKTT